MKKIYFISFSLLVIPFLFGGCSKDIFKSYDKRIIGTWSLVDVDRLGFGSSMSLPFTDGKFTFLPSGQLEYTDVAGNFYQGDWDIRKDLDPGYCSTDENGFQHCDDQYVHRLKVTATDYQRQETRSEFFDEIVFTGTNRIRACIYTATKTYIFRFRR